MFKAYVDERTKWSSLESLCLGLVLGKDGPGGQKAWRAAEGDEGERTC